MKPATLYPKVAAALCAATLADVTRSLAKVEAESARLVREARTDLERGDARVMPIIDRMVAMESALAILVGAVGGAHAEIQLRHLLGHERNDYNHGPFVREQAEESARRGVSA